VEPLAAEASCLFHVSMRHKREREIEKFIKQPPMGEKDDYDSENSWISDGLPISSRRRRRATNFF